MDITGYLQKQGFSTISPEFYSIIESWNSWYQGDVQDFHRYSVYTGARKVKCRRYSLQMAKKVCEDWANLLINERVSITLGTPETEGDAALEQQFLDETLADNNFWVRINEMQEVKAACGTAAYLPYAEGVEADPETGEVIRAKRVRLDYIAADQVFPLSWENGVIRECAFGTVLYRQVEGKLTKILYLKIHRLDELGEYVIDSGVFDCTNDSLKELPLSTVEGFERVPARVYTHSAERQFVIDRLNIANNLDRQSPMGIAVFANSIDVLKELDLIYDSFANEYTTGKKRIMVAKELLKPVDGEMAFDPNDVTFYQIEQNVGEDTLIKEIDMTLRVTEHTDGLQMQLNLLSAKCGFGESHYQYDRGSVQTATQIVSENSTLFRTLKKHEIILESVLKELVKLILTLGRDMLKLPLNPDIEVTIDFDDSIIEDTETEFSRDARLVQMNVMGLDEFRAKWMHEDLETAKANLPEMVGLMEE